LQRFDLGTRNGYLNGDEMGVLHFTGLSCEELVMDFVLQVLMPLLPSSREGQNVEYGIF
jgi:hypothetical protein